MPPTAHPLPRSFRRSLPRRFGVAALLALAVTAMAISTALGVAWLSARLTPEWVREGLTNRLSAAFGRPVVFSDLELSLFEGSFLIGGLQVGRMTGGAGPAPPALSIEEIRGRLSWRSLAPPHLHLENLEVAGVAVRGLDDGGQPVPESPPLAPWLSTLVSRVAFSTDRMTISGSTIGYRNRPTPWEVRADEVRLSVQAGDDGGVDGRISYGRGVMRLWEQPDLPMALEAELRLRGSVLHLDRVELRADLLAVDLDGSLDLANDLSGPMGMRGVGDAGALGRFLFDFDGLDTDGEERFAFDGQAAFQDNGLAVDGDFVLPGGRFYGVPFRDWGGVLHWDPDRIEIVESDGVAFGGVGSLRLRQVQPREENPADLFFEVRRGDLAAAVDGLYGVETTLRSHLDLTADLRLPLADPLRMTGTVEARGLAPAAAEPGGSLPFGLEASLALDDEGVTVGRLAFTGPAYRASAEGRYPQRGAADFTAEAVAGESAQVDAMQQELRRVLFAESPETTVWEVAGGGRFDGTVTGRWPDLVIEGEVEGRGMRFSTIHTETLLAVGRIGRDTIWLDRLSARFGESRLAASGVFDRGEEVYPDMEFDAEWEDWDIPEIVDFLEWDLVASGTATGHSETVRRSERYTGGGAVTGRNGDFLEQPFDEARVAWTLDGERARLDPISGAFRGGAAEGSLDIGLVEWEMDGRLTGADFPLTPGLAPEWISIRSDFTLDIGGDLLVPALDLDARVPAASVLGLPLGPGAITGAVRGETFVGRGALDSGAASFRMEGVVPLGTEGGGTVTVRAVEVAPLISAAAAEQGFSVIASGRGDFHLENPHDEWMTGSATITGLDLAAPDFAASLTAPAEVRLADARVELDPLELRRDEARLLLAGAVDLDAERLDLSISGRTSLAAAEPLVEGLDAEGELSLDVGVRGPWTSPGIVGAGRIRDGSFRFAGFPHALREVAGEIAFDRNTVRAAEVAGRLGSGNAVISGSISFADAEADATDLRMRITDARLRYPADLSALVSADLRVLGDRDLRLLTGSVTLEDAVWSREYELFSSILSDLNAVTESSAPEAGTLDGFRLDVRVGTASPFTVRNSIFELAAAADLGLRGTAGAPALLGRADLVGGEVFFGAHRFQIVSGRADFIDPEGIEPVFDLEAETTVRSYRVRLRAAGTTEQIQANLSSEPPLREPDILRLLSGAPEQDLLRAGGDDEVAAATAATLLSQQLSNLIGRRAGRVFGIDRFSIDPFLIGHFSNPTARVTLGKQLSPDLSVRYSSSLSTTEESIIVVEYTPRGPVSWIFSRDRDGSLGVDVRFHRSF